MRATNLSFRSPKEKTAEYLLPEVTSTGTRLSFALENKKVNLALGKRFTQYIVDSRRTDGIGPGSYNVTKFPSVVKPTHNRSKTLETPAISPYRFYNLSTLLSEYQKKDLSSQEPN